MSLYSDVLNLYYDIETLCYDMNIGLEDLIHILIERDGDKVKELVDRRFMEYTNEFEEEDEYYGLHIEEYDV